MTLAEQRTITIVVTGKEPLPEAIAFSHVVQDTISALAAIEADLAGPEVAPIVWRVSQVSMNTPISLTLVADNGAARQKDRGRKVVTTYMDGMSLLERSAILPAHFSDVALARAKRIAGTLNNGVAAVEYSAPGKEPCRPTLRLVRNIDELYAKRPETIYQISSVEGRLEVISIHGGFAAQVFTRAGDRVVCGLSQPLMKVAAKYFSKRVAVHGRIQYTREGKPVRVEAREIRVLKDRGQLPQFADLEDIDITDGMDPTEYIGSLRDAN